mmetsp:Transcript_110375/g.246668  ORF Transcript_110375/g.246668 Transcript_110375/m.246668 type:complete len:241 (+) Transcript_110375:314-1036(+)
MDIYLDTVLHRAAPAPAFTLACGRSGPLDHRTHLFLERRGDDDMRALQPPAPLTEVLHDRLEVLRGHEDLRTRGQHRVHFGFFKRRARLLQVDALQEGTVEPSAPLRVLEDYHLHGARRRASRYIGLALHQGLLQLGLLDLQRLCLAGMQRLLQALLRRRLLRAIVAHLPRGRRRHHRIQRATRAAVHGAEQLLTGLPDRGHHLSTSPIRPRPLRSLTLKMSTKLLYILYCHWGSRNCGQ